MFTFLSLPKSGFYSSLTLLQSAVRICSVSPDTYSPVVLYTAVCFGCPDQPSAVRCRKHRKTYKGERLLITALWNATVTIDNTVKTYPLSLSLYCLSVYRTLSAEGWSGEPKHVAVYNNKLYLYDVFCPIITTRGSYHPAFTCLLMSMASLLAMATLTIVQQFWTISAAIGMNGRMIIWRR